MDIDSERAQAHKQAQDQLEYQRRGKWLLLAADEAIDEGDVKAATAYLDDHEDLWIAGVAQGLTRPEYQFQSPEYLCAASLRKRVELLEAGEPLLAKYNASDGAAAWGTLSEAMQKSIEAGCAVNLETGEIVRHDVALEIARMEAKHPPECSCRKDDPEAEEKYRAAIALLRERGERLPDTWRVPTNEEYMASRGL